MNVHENWLGVSLPGVPPVSPGHRRAAALYPRRSAPDQGLRGANPADHPRGVLATQLRPLPPLGAETPDDHGKHDAEEQKQPIIPADATSGRFGGVELRLKLHHLRTGQRVGVFANSIISRSRTAISACSSNVNGVLSASTKRAPVRIFPSRSRSAQRSGVSTSRLTSSAHRRTSSSTFAQLKASDSLAGLSPTITFAVVKGRGALLARHSSTSSRGRGPRPASTWCPRGLRSASPAAAMPERRSSA